MPLAKLVCPKCRAVLKPAKPVPEGKTVKCPKCEETFKAGDKPGEEKAPAAKKSAAAKAAPAEEEEVGTYAVLKDEDEEKKKAAAEERLRRKKKKRKRADFEDDDEERDEEDEDEEDEEKDDIASQYLESLKPNDPRGAAQETVVPVANWLLRTALIGFFGWVFYFGALMLPVAFPNIEKKEEVDQFHPAAGKDKKEEHKEKKQAQHFWSAEPILHGGKTADEQEEYEAWSIILFLFVLILGLVQAGAIANASVKMQSLESYNWSLWGCILACIPLFSVPWFVFFTYLFDLADWLIEMGLDETCWMLSLVVFAWMIVGFICLKKFLEPQVKPGYEYKPE